MKLTDVTKTILTGAAIGLMLGTTFVVGFLSRELLLSVSANVAEPSFPLLEEVQRLVDLHYLRDQPSELTREYAAVRGLLGSLNDRYTFFIEPQVAQSESDALAGVYGGVGMQVRANAPGEFIIFRYENSPASKAGIATNDILIAINGDPVSGMLSIDSINQFLRGEVQAGNGAEVTYQASSDDAIITVFLPFEIIEVPSLTWTILPENEQIGYIQISLFTNRTPDELEVALNGLTEGGVQGLVLDLRNNSGGLLQESVEVASFFLKDAFVVYERTHVSERGIRSVTMPVAWALPMVVLINNNTASAAELVAVALQDNDRAVLVGQSTYGKGSIQQIFRLMDGSSLHVTTAEWLSPNQRQFDGMGIAPDILISAEESQTNRELQAAIELLTSIAEEG